MALPANTVFRDYATDGVPSSGNREPVKSEIRALLTYHESLLILASVNGLVYSTRAALYANLAPAANEPALVIGDPTAGYDGLYGKVGATTTGSWNRIGYAPGHQFSTASDAGAGTTNAIIATSSPAVEYSDGAQLIRLNIFETTTSGVVTVAFDGGAALTIQTASGNAPASGGLIAGMTILGVVDQSASVFRMLSDQASAAIVADAEAARTATAADVVSTAADVVSTNADVVLTNADAVATNADRVQTGLDAVATAADRVQTGLEVTAAALARTGAETAETGAEAAQAAAEAAAASSTSTTDASQLTSGTLADARLPTRLGVYAKTVTDWDDATENGMYMGNGDLNSPVAGFYIGYVEARNEDWMTQTVHNLTSNTSENIQTWGRDKKNGNWSSWYKLQLSEAEQDARYLASPTFTGVPAAPTAAPGTDTTQLATTAYTRTAVADVLNATGSAPMYACRAWVNFNGIGTVAIRASGNVSSITDNGTGDYTVNFATAMPDANYAMSASAQDSDSGGDVIIGRPNGATKTTAACRIRVVSAASTAQDSSSVEVMFFR